MGAACSSVRQVAMVNVAGHWMCKCLYYLLCVVVGLVFLRGVENTLLSWRSTVITVATMDMLESVPFPTMWACISADVQELFNMKKYSHFDKLSPNGTCKSGNGTGVGEVWSKALITTSTGVADCDYWRTHTPFTNELESWFSRTGGRGMQISTRPGTEYTCISLNEDGAFVDHETHPNLYWLEWMANRSDSNANSDGHIIVGLADPALLQGTPDYEYLTKYRKSAFQSYIVGLRRSFSTAGISMDTLVDERDRNWRHALMSYAKTSLGFLRKSNVTRLYSAGFIPVKGAKDQWSAVMFRMQTYLSQTVTTRYESFDEVWSALGGMWASSVLVLAMFFVRKSVTDPNGGGAVSQDVMISRFGTVSNVRDMEALLVEELQNASEVQGVTGGRMQGLGAAAKLAAGAHVAATQVKDNLGGVEASVTEVRGLLPGSLDSESSSTDGSNIDSSTEEGP